MSRYSKSLWTRRRLLGASAMALATPVIAPRRAWAASNEIRVGWVSPTTGPVAGFGQTDDFVINGLQPVLDAGIDIDGKHYDIKLIRKDNQSNPNRSAEVASELILDDEVHLMLSSSTGDTVIPVSDQCELNEVPSVSADTPWDAFFFARGGDPAVGFDWTHHFFWGSQQATSTFTSLWSQLDTNKRVGLLMANDSDGVAMSHPEVGMAAQLRGHGMDVVDLGLFEPMSDDFSAQIGKLKDAQVDILMGVFVPPDWVTFWAQAHQQGFNPKAATIAKALLFPSSVEAVGPTAVGLSTEIWWSPGHPFKSSITGQSSKDFADEYTAATGRQWVQPKGFKHALLEVGLDVLKRSGDPHDPGAMVEAIRGTDLDTMVGHINFMTGPVPNVSATPLVGGQWRKGENFPFDLAICENQYAPEIPTQSEMRALSY